MGWSGTSISRFCWLPYKPWSLPEDAFFNLNPQSLPESSPTQEWVHSGQDEGSVSQTHPRHFPPFRHPHCRKLSQGTVCPRKGKARQTKDPLIILLGSNLQYSFMPKLGQEIQTWLLGLLSPRYHWKRQELCVVFSQRCTRLVTLSSTGCKQTGSQEDSLSGLFICFSSDLVISFLPNCLLWECITKCSCPSLFYSPAWKTYLCSDAALREHTEAVSLPRPWFGQTPPKPLGVSLALVRGSQSLCIFTFRL